MTIEQAIKQEMTPRTEKFWGNRYENFHPEKLSRTFGDGQRLMYLTPLNTRPYYFIAKVDSKYPSTEDEEHDFIEKLLDALEEEFGVADEENREFPLVNLDSGYTWGFLN
jgi:hypothetical protein